MAAGPVSLTSYWRLLQRNRNFRFLWLAQMVSEMGDWFYSIAIYSLLLELTGSATAVAAAVVLQVLPQFFIAPLAGVVAGVSVAAIFGVVMRMDAQVGRDKTFTRQQYLPGFDIEDIMYLAGPITWAGGLEYLLLAASIGTPVFLVIALAIARGKLPTLARRAA